MSARDSAKEPPLPHRDPQPGGDSKPTFSSENRPDERSRSAHRAKVGAGLELFESDGRAEAPGGAAGDLDPRDLITLRQAKEHPALRHLRPSIETLGRWTVKGCLAQNGQYVRLEAAVIGGRKMSSAAAVERFVSRLNDRSLAPLPEADRSRLAHRRAECELASRGI